MLLGKMITFVWINFHKIFFDHDNFSVPTVNHLISEQLFLRKYSHFSVDTVISTFCNTKAVIWSFITSVISLVTQAPGESNKAQLQCYPSIQKSKISILSVWISKHVSPVIECPLLKQITYYECLIIQTKTSGYWVSGYCSSLDRWITIFLVSFQIQKSVNRWTTVFVYFVCDLEVVRISKQSH